MKNKHTNYRELWGQAGSGWHDVIASHETKPADVPAGGGDVASYNTLTYVMASFDADHNLVISETTQGGESGSFQQHHDAATPHDGLRHHFANPGRRDW